MNTSNNALTEAVYYILLALITPLHGYGIMQRTAELSGGRLVISAGTLYGALSTLMDKGWIEQLEVLSPQGVSDNLCGSCSSGAGACPP